MPPPRWQLPSGCTPGLWDYTHSRVVAEDYDNYFSHHKLLEFDQHQVLSWLRRESRPGDLVADIGCGTGRALLPLIEAGYRGLGIDLSEHMLEQLRSKAAAQQLEVETLLANWVELDQVADASVDHCISLFSTLGMIHGRANRRAALRHTRRIMRPGGLLLMHVHNFWFNLYDAGGPWWALQSLLCSPFRRDSERGDKYFPYRGVPNMFLHVFTAGEIRRDLRHAGFRIRALTPIRAATQQTLPQPWLLPSLRACGWIVVAQ